MKYLLDQWAALPSYVRDTAWILVVTISLILCVAFTTLWERKVIGWMQLRKGPNRVGSVFGFAPGIFQPFADVIKLLIKEVRSKAVIFVFQFRKTEGGKVLPDVLAQGEIAAVCVTSDAAGKMVAQPIPADVKAKLEPAAPGAYTL